MPALPVPETGIVSWFSVLKRYCKQFPHLVHGGKEIGVEVADTGGRQGPATLGPRRHWGPAPSRLALARVDIAELVGVEGHLWLSP